MVWVCLSTRAPISLSHSTSSSETFDFFSIDCSHERIRKSTITSAIAVKTYGKISIVLRLYYFLHQAAAFRENFWLKPVFFVVVSCSIITIALIVGWGFFDIFYRF